MAIDKSTIANIDKSDLTNYPFGRIKDNDGTGNGTPVNRALYSDLHEFFGKLMRLAAIPYNALPENEANGYQLIQALIALAGKNDYIETINSVAGVLAVSNINLSILNTNEAMVCQVSADYASETEITGTQAGVSFVLSVPKSYKANDYVRLIRTSTGIKLVQLVDGVNADSVVGLFNYLKGATNSQAITGVATNVAVTPAALLAAFTDWVNGADSASFRATHSVDGLMSKTDKALLDSLNNPVKNTGWFSGVDVGGGTVGSSAPVGGDIVSAVIQTVTPGSSSVGCDIVYLVTMAHAMANTSYFVRMHMQSEGVLLTDNNLRAPVFRPVSTTQFQWSASEAEPGTQNIKVHLEVVQI